ncbi:hypothetical protein [Microvirga mediterraneensis]|uniref:Uncharacterized protein n=1 Tax=Microvirga mediterraneensis TaxID=2754695 RepID=A0A838BNL5_9HYPH|nr:hypothetical protein [Microvirga mediterraneensis]MBA1157038.1 hypothetical protein [Microvirga mediterraneensis]
MTAAHVVSALKASGQVGLVRFLTTQVAEQRVTLDMSQIGDVIFGSEPWTEHGPDLAFMTLPYDIAGSLAGAGCVFIDLERRREILATGQFGASGFWCLAGAVGERMHLTGQTATRAIVHVEASVEPGTVSPLTLADNFDGYDFTPDTHPAYQAPESYEGMSGGGLWIAHADAPDAEKLSTLSFVGVNFWQTDVEIPGRRVLCHGPSGIYGRLVSEVAQKFS